MRVSWEDFPESYPGSSYRQWGLSCKMGPFGVRGRDDSRPPQDGGLGGSNRWPYVAKGEFRDSEWNFATVCGAALEKNLLRIWSFVERIWNDGKY